MSKLGTTFVQPREFLPPGVFPRLQASERAPEVFESSCQAAPPMLVLSDAWVGGKESFNTTLNLGYFVYDPVLRDRQIHDGQTREMFFVCFCVVCW